MRFLCGVERILMLGIALLFEGELMVVIWMMRLIWLLRWRIQGPDCMNRSGRQISWGIT